MRPAPAGRISASGDSWDAFVLIPRRPPLRWRADAATCATVPIPNCLRNYGLTVGGPDGRTRTGPDTFEPISDSQRALVLVEAQRTDCARASASLGVSAQVSGQLD